jgi:hypothetical protein
MVASVIVPGLESQQLVKVECVRHKVGLTALPRDDREVSTLLRPNKSVLCLTQTFELHGELTFPHFVVREGLERI